MKKYLVLVLSIVFLTISADADAQRRRGTKKREKKENTENVSRQSRQNSRASKEVKKFSDNINPEIKIGYVGGNSNGYFTTLGVSLKGNVGYKIGKSFTAGIGSKLAYQYLNPRSAGPSEHSFDLGAFAYGRFKFFENIYIQGEYIVERLDNRGASGIATINYPTAGFGYLNMGPRWSVGPEINFILDDDVVDLKGSVMEYWINASYRF